MSHTFNEFQRELIKREIKPQEAYMFTLIYERLSECENQLTMCARLLSELADTVTTFAHLHEHTTRQLQQVLRGSKQEGVDVQSVAHDPNDTEH